MKALLGAHDVWDVVEKGFIVPENEATLTAAQKENLKDLKKKENKAKYLIFQSLDEDAFEKIAGTTSSKEAWEKLETSYKRAEQVKKEGCKPMKKNKKRSKESKNNFSKWKSIQRKEKKAPTTREGTMSEVEVKDEVEVVVMNEVGISTTTTPIMPKEKAQPEDEAEAIQNRECRAPSTRIEERVNYAEAKNGEDGTLLLAHNDTSGGQENTWYLDTGAGNHMSGNRSMFVQLSESVNGSVAFGDDSKVPVKGRVEKESGYQIKAMRSDRGGEFTSKEFLEFCEANGIRRPLTVPRSPQQNGVAKRKNRTILDMARSMLKSKRLPKEFWAEAVACAVYLSNRSPTRSVWGKTPQEAWSGKKPSITHLRVFGSIAHVHVPDESRAKLDDKTPTTYGDSPLSFLNERTEERTRSLQDLYEVTERYDNLTLFCLFADCEPVNFQEAALDEKWRITMDEEIKAIVKNDTWELTTLPKSHKAIGVKWVYKTKRNAKGEIERHKARLVAKGYSQKAGIDYDEVFAPVALLETIRLIISLAAQNKWKIFQMDVKSAFLNGLFEEEVYIEQPLGYVVKGHEDKILRLKKALYGLKQAPRAWNSRIDKYFQEKGFTKCPYEHALYIKEKYGDILIVCLYVDDLIFTESNPSLFEEFKRVMIKEFEMTDIGLMAYYLGIEVKQKEEGIFISQESYAKEILKKFKMNDCKPISTPVECGVKLSKHDKGEDIDPTFFKSLVGSLRYLTCTRPDILYAVGLVSRYMENPKTTHFKAAKRILRYIKGTTNFGLLYSFSKNYKLVGYSDSDWGGNVDDRKSTTGFVFFMGDTAFTWMSKKQPIVTLSTCEAEYVADTSSVCHAIWLRNLLKELSLAQEEPTEICVDNKSAIALSKNLVFHDRSKHIDTRYHFIRECIARKEVQIKYVKSQDQAANIFTKPLKQEDFVRFRSLLGVTGSSLRGGVGS
ncbi:hypothetical protein KPL70_021844 [Citrus sinensis]|nr:hypothetical protein KPL70_021844 [Citrus sinensis]